jgi:putative membrane protein
MMMRLIVRLLINAAALAAAAWAVPGIHYEGWGALALMALVFGLVNALIRPIVMILSCPLLVLTLGLFTFVVNACMLLLAGSLAGMFGIAFSVEGFVPAFLGAIIISVVSIILSILLPHRRREEA